MECKESFDLCFKCFPRSPSFHNLDHHFESIGPLYYEGPDVGSAEGQGTKEEVASVHEGDLVLEEYNESGSDDLELDSDSQRKAGKNS